MISGMCERTGRHISGEDYLRQCFKRVLFTSKETLLNHRGFGSDIAELLAEPLNRTTLTDLCSESAQALEEWVAGLKVNSVSVSMNDAKDGSVCLSIDFKFNHQNIRITVDDKP